MCDVSQKEKKKIYKIVSTSRCKCCFHLFVYFTSSVAFQMSIFPSSLFFVLCKDPASQDHLHTACTATHLKFQHVYKTDFVMTVMDDMPHRKSHTIYTKTFHFFINFVNVELVYRVNCQ